MDDRSLKPDRGKYITFRHGVQKGSGNQPLSHPNSKVKGLPATGRGDPKRSSYVKAPDFLDLRHYKGDRSSAISTGRL